MDKRLFYLLNLAQHRIKKWADAECEQRFGVTSTQLAALFFVFQSPQCRTNELGEGLSLNKSGTTGLVQRLELAELIVRAPCTEDARVSRLRLTKRGKQIVQSGLGILSEFNTTLSDGFSSEEISTVLRFLNVCVEKFK